MPLGKRGKEKKGYIQENEWKERVKRQVNEWKEKRRRANTRNQWKEKDWWGSSGKSCMVKMSDPTLIGHLCTKNRQRGNHEEAKQVLHIVI
jgi:hypothetical protein